MQKYRSDIDGLRALAVLPVVLYHAGFEAFSGGFIGVDVFFVISGYLITSILIFEREDGRFSIVEFYERRIRRIFPALFTVIAFCALASPFLLFPNDLKDFGQSVVATTGFSSNFLFWLESGYFDAPAEQKPLLHTWSLAVEEQFYIFFPLLILLVAKFAKRRYLPYFAGTAVLSFAASLYGVAYAPEATFYLLPTRAWELLIGAILACGALPVTSNTAARNLIALAGLLLITYAVFGFSEVTPFPGANALFPCLGTAFIIYAGNTTSAPGSPLPLVNRVMSLQALVFLGLVSYSLYLWHWPLLVFARLFALRQLTVPEAWGVIAASLLLAILSWRYVERPFRGRSTAIARLPLFAGAGSVMAASIAFGLAIHVSGGLPGRVPKDLLEIAKVGSEVSPFYKDCSYITPEEVRAGALCKVGASQAAPPSFVVWGDSHALAAVYGVDQQASREMQSGLFAYYIGCPPLTGVSRLDKSESHWCRDFNDAVMEQVETIETIESVVLVARWALYSEGTGYGYVTGRSYLGDDDSEDDGTADNKPVFRRSLERTIEQLHGLGKRVFILAQVPEVKWLVPEVMSRGVYYDRPIDIRPQFDAYVERQAFATETFNAIAQKFPIEILRPADVLCDRSHCKIAIDGQPLYRDDDHLSSLGSETVSRVFVPVFEDRAETSRSN
ncbi:acyltransferase family protein [Pelagibius sp. Alg239-R121]|uniref:acyltransferase family protein n=1 Tax=Pelagibius sp. Alg239-R121 TaxID=2993448 RepID=UPI0024A73D01|nr:acyltransferase family protein [Pelagibius sp. Alg239-R121]